MTAPVLSHDDVNDAYSRWAPFYDAAFAWVMRPGRVATAALLNQTGGRVLDVGVGTGLELPMFGPNVRITGIDLCEPMLNIARKRVETHKLGNVDDLLVMDAMDLKFPDASFDAVIGPYVLTVVPEPERTLDEMARVVKPGGEIILSNHIGAESGPVACFEGWLGKRSAALGWRPQFPWSIVTDWLARRPDIELIERKPLDMVGLFTLIRMKRKAAPSP
jgi:phosphatidylethanolamine/phosphatidyl-N-methylethanolamine N-methyltransferase